MLCRTLSEKLSQTVAWEVECSHSQRERVGIGRRGKKYHLDIVEISSAKRCGSEIVDLDDGWKLFYSGADLFMSDQAGVVILTSP